MRKSNLVTRTESSKKKASRPLTSGMKRVDGDKFQDYIITNRVDKIAICDKLNVNRGFINDIIRQNRARTCLFNVICDEIGVKRNFFDMVEKAEEPDISDTEEVPKDVNLETIHDDLMSLIASNRRLETLMQGMIDMWRND